MPDLDDQSRRCCRQMLVKMNVVAEKFDFMTIYSTEMRPIVKIDFRFGRSINENNVRLSNQII